MNRLGERIARLIEASGPLSVADYMALCLFDPDEGYYTTRQPFGADGDFTTAPEISQMFGELVGVWIYSAWTAIGRPLPVTIAEIGPGRGTLMKDILRTLSRLDAGLAAGACFAMIEASPRLSSVQKATLADVDVDIFWHQTIATLPAEPLIIVANELFDALPVRQFVRVAEQWHERCIGLGETQRLHFLAGAGSLDRSLLPPNTENAPDGSIFEVSNARTAMMEAIAEVIAMHNGAGLFIDYGHLEPGLGDTFQAVRNHCYEDVLESPGEADLTSHVDFAALATAARAKGLDAYRMTQGDFLLRTGLVERAGRLGSDADEATREKISAEVERLAGPDAMGKLFKVLAIFPPGIVVPPFDRSS